MVTTALAPPTVVPRFERLKPVILAASRSVALIVSAGLLILALLPVLLGAAGARVPITR